MTANMKKEGKKHYKRKINGCNMKTFRQNIVKFGGFGETSASMIVHIHVKLN